MRVPFFGDFRNRLRNAVAGVGLILVLFFSLNALVGDMGQAIKWDLTEDAVYTLRESTHAVLRSLDEPVSIRLFYSSALDERAPALALYHDRVRTVLEQYTDLGNGKIRLEYFDPEPFSETEDRAVSSGIQNWPLSDAGDQAYFGLMASNSTDDWDAIPFLNPEREGFLEYDLTRMIYNLANPDRPVVGVMSSVPLLGARRNNRPLVVMETIDEFFEVRHIALDGTDIPEDVDVLMIVHPRAVPDDMMYAIDQFILGGGRALVFVDSHAEMDVMYADRPGAVAGRSEFDALLAAWGVKLAEGRVAGDIDNAQRVGYQEDGQSLSVDYVGWLSLSSGNFDTHDVVMAELDSLNLATAGILDPVGESSATARPLIVTGPRSMRLDINDLGMTPDVAKLFREFAPSGKTEMLAARIGGEAGTIFGDRGGPLHLDRSVSPLNLIVVADVDILDDRFWINRRDVLGQEIRIPLANNGDFLLNALENLSGSPALISLRGRGVTSRPFERVEAIRLEAERAYRAKEQELRTGLREAEQQFNDLISRRGADSDVILSKQDEKLIEDLRARMLEIRAELRVVRHRLGRDIDALESRLKFVNIAVMPLVLVTGLAVLMIVHHRRRVSVSETAPEH